MGWFIIDPVLLKTNLIESLVYLHIQPPLYNLCLGVLLKLFPQQYVLVFYFWHLCCGLIILFSLYTILDALNIKPLLNLFLTACFIVSPALLMYENELYYTYPVLCLLTLSAAVLIYYIKNFSVKWGFCFFLLLAALCLTRNMFQLVWFVFWVALLLWKYPPHRKTILYCALIPFLLVLSLSVKNFILFGHFGSSTWLGNHFTRTTINNLTRHERSQLIKEGKLSLAAERGAYDPIEWYDPILRKSDTTNIPVLDQKINSGGSLNYNHLGYIRISHLKLKDALYALTHYPLRYLKRIIKSFSIFMQPPSQSYVLGEKKRCIYFQKIDNNNYFKKYNKIYNVVFYGDTTALTNSNKVTSTFYTTYLKGKIFSMIIFLIVTVYGIKLAFAFLKDEASPSSYNMLLLYMAFNIFYVSLCGNLIEFGENFRFRFLVEPFFVAFLGVTLNKLLLKLKKC
jgi:hypothetical protein